MKIAVIHDGSYDDVLDTVYAALGEHEADLIFVDVSVEPHAPGVALAPGDAVLRVSESRFARLVEDRLRGAGIATLASGLDARPADLPSLWRAHGLPVRLEMPFQPLDREEAVAYVERLGGFPAAVRAIDHDASSSVLRVDSPEALFSALDLLDATGVPALVGAWVERPVLWRVLLLDGGAVDAAKRVALDLDWHGAGETAWGVAPRADVAALGGSALAALGTDTGTVDLLERHDTTFALLAAEVPPRLLDLAAWASEDTPAKVVSSLVARARRARVEGLP